jgi:hypothetical protein
LASTNEDSECSCQSEVEAKDQVVKRREGHARDVILPFRQKRKEGASLGLEAQKLFRVSPNEMVIGMAMMLSQGGGEEAVIDQIAVEEASAEDLPCRMTPFAGQTGSKA